MKPIILTQFKAGILQRLLLLFLSISSAGLSPTTVLADPLETVPIYNPFFVRNYSGKCLDVGEDSPVEGGPVFINDCNKSASQRVAIVEVDLNPNGKHEVLLFVGNNKVIGVTGNALFSSIPLEIQDYTGSVGQIFALDGDSIILAADRNLVVEVQNGRGVNRTPLVVGYRDLNDAEFWTFTSSDGSNRRPTRGFVRISQINNFDDGGELQARQDFLKAFRNAHWGTVIELDSNVAIRLTNLGTLPIPAGVTIRGERRNTQIGPEIRTWNAPERYMFSIDGENVRITGLRLRGPSRSLRFHDAEGILARSEFATIIDHNELSDWPRAAIAVEDDKTQAQKFLLPEKVRIEQNLIHHNRGTGFGYGVVIGGGGYATIWGNTFVENRHAIAGDGSATSGYRAWYNLVLQASPDYGNGPQQDFDMHGTGNDPCQHCGGIAGEYIKIARNTFLGGNRENFYLRGTPTYQAEFHNNILVGLRSFVIKNLGDTDKLIIRDNQFLSPNPARHLGVGDFDGDGKQDLFLATGAAWYYSSAGKAEWRYLNPQTDTLQNLLFGDFDADGRTDVFTQHAYGWDVSWGGSSPWDRINVSWSILGNSAVGDFIGDERDDVFYSDGERWYASDGGIGEFTPIGRSSYRVLRLRFGDFNGDGKTDIFSIVDGAWKVSYSGTSRWTFLRSRLTDSVSGLTIGDFNGDGHADIATSVNILSGNHIWRVSYRGTANWITLRSNSPSLALVPAIGRFDANASTDVLVWHSYHLDMVSGGSGTPIHLSREDMR
jgi:hypothetical protein